MSFLVSEQSTDLERECVAQFCKQNKQSNDNLSYKKFLLNIHPDTNGNNSEHAHCVEIINNKYKGSYQNRTVALKKECKRFGAERQAEEQQAAEERRQAAERQAAAELSEDSLNHQKGRKPGEINSIFKKFFNKITDSICSKTKTELKETKETLYETQKQNLNIASEMAEKEAYLLTQLQIKQTDVEKCEQRIKRNNAQCNNILLELRQKSNQTQQSLEAAQNELQKARQAQQKLEKEKQTLQNEQETLQKEKKTLQKEKETLQNEQETLILKRKKLMQSLQQLNKERRLLEEEKQNLEKERRNLENEKDQLNEEIRLFNQKNLQPGADSEQIKTKTVRIRQNPNFRYMSAEEKKKLKDESLKNKIKEYQEYARLRNNSM